MIRRHPRIFERIGTTGKQRIAINPTNLPFVLLLQPDADDPKLCAYRSLDNLSYDALISGSVLNLLRMVDGQIDGDALFFTRDLKIEGNTEAIVCLRNALDDMDHTLAEELAVLLGPIGGIGLRALRNYQHKRPAP